MTGVIKKLKWTELRICRENAEEEKNALLDVVHMELKYQYGMVKWKHWLGLKVVSSCYDSITDTFHALVFSSVKLC